MNFKTFDLNLLRVLDALLDTGSTTEAGRRLGMSQPAVSAALGRLRHALDDPLFIRQGRRLAATDFATGLRDPLRELLEKTERMLSGNQSFDPMQATHVFKLSGSDFYAEMLMPRLAEHLARTAPGIRAQLVDLVPDNHVRTIDRHQVDLAILPVTSFPSWIDWQPLHRSRFVVIARQDHPDIARAGLRPGQEMPLDLFCTLHHVAFSPEGRLRTMGDAALARLDRSRRVSMTLPVFSGVCHAVSQSDLIALLPHQLAAHLAPRLTLSIYEAPLPDMEVTLAMAWHRRATTAPAHRWLRDSIAQLAAALDTP